MTENENIQATLEDALYCAKSWLGEEVCEECRFYPLCHTFCDDVAEIIVQALEEIQQYRAIGTLEEFKALKEKSVAKKVVVEHIPKTSWTKEISHYLCPSCRSIFSFGGKPYCSKCGQKLDWQ